MAKRSFVGVGLFAKRKDLGVPKHLPAQSGTAFPTDKKSKKFGSQTSKKGSNERKYHSQQAK